MPKYLLIILLYLSMASGVQAQRVYVANSVLSTGNWYKIAIQQEGIYKIDVAFLNSLGINTSNLSSGSIRLYGNGGAMLSENNAVKRTDDLAENPIEMYDGGDGIFNGTDYFLFYAPGPQQWIKDSSHQSFIHQKNLYSDSSYYYITIAGSGSRIGTDTAKPVPTTTVTSYDERYFYEPDSVNLLNSGKQWYGIPINPATGTFGGLTYPVSYTGLIATQPLVMSYSLAASSAGNSSSFTVSVNGQQAPELSIAPVTGYFLDPYAVENASQSSFTGLKSPLNIQFNFNPASAGAIGWLDWFELHGRKILDMNNGSQVTFRDWQSVAPGQAAAFTIANATTVTEVWEITNPLQPLKMNCSFSNDQAVFTRDASLLREYIAFGTTGFLTAVAIGAVPNQNLHQSSRADLIIITHSSLLAQAQQLAAFHQQHDGDVVVLATTAQVYNEFSSGTPDPSAIRDFVKMYYDKAAGDSSLMPGSLILFGAGSFDYKHRIANNTNLVPVYESVSSLDPLATFTSDDFFALLSDADNINNSSPGMLALGVGRLPARNVQEATNMVNKIIRYHGPGGMGPWRNQTVYAADNGDNDLHVQDAETVSSDAMNTNPLFNQSKIYLDAYPLVSSSAGTRFPAVNTAIVNQVFNGTLLFNYNGHGGYQQLSGSAVLGKTELQQFNDPDKLPLFITATCDFAPYDDPTKNALGCSILSSDSIGGIGLMTTSRDVYAASNLVLNDNYLKIALQPDNQGNYLSLGKALQRSKNYTYANYNDVVNNRKFVLLGDPAMQLAFPKGRVQLTAINGQPVSGNDTLKALNKYTFTGIVTDATGNLQSGFNGNLYSTLYDKAQTIYTLGNDPTSPVMPFTTQTNVLFKGVSTVKNGYFSFSCIIPQDISYLPGTGRLSLYAENGLTDANGIANAFNIGGSTNTADTLTAGPQIQLYLNNLNFSDGGLTDENPLLIALLSDSLGINTTGNGIGHNITAILDSNQANPIILNNYYTALADSYQQGQVIYQLTSLTPGKHTITLKAWDIADHSAQSSLHFIVADKQSLQLSNLYNYPNPFTGTTHFSFDHNQPGVPLQVALEIYNSYGQLVYHINTNFTDAGSRNTSLQWDGNGDNGRKMASGIYFYRIIVASSNGVSTAVQKIILR